MKTKKKTRQSPKGYANVTQFNAPKKRDLTSRIFHTQKGGSTMPEVILSDYFCGDESEEFIISA